MGVRSFDKFFDFLNNFYERILNSALRHRFIVITAGVAAIILAAVLLKYLPSELVPTEDRGIGFGIIIAPEGATSGLHR